MSIQLIIEGLENIAASIAEKAELEFQKDPESIGGDLLERGFDSLDFIDYLMEIEEKYGSVSDEDLETYILRSTESMAKFLFERDNK